MEAEYSIVIFNKSSSGWSDWWGAVKSIHVMFSCVSCEKLPCSLWVYQATAVHSIKQLFMRSGAGAILKKTFFFVLFFFPIFYWSVLTQNDLWGHAVLNLQLSLGEECDLHLLDFYNTANLCTWIDCVKLCLFLL